jgi:FkbM family methyltransferase
VVDVGCADDADFSQHLIARFGVTAFAVDPTRKHEPALRALEKRLRPKLIHLPLALANRAGRVPFNESVENVSGSLLAGHVNVRRDHVKSYEVEAVTLADLTLRIGYARIDLLKLDIEGAEFDLLREVAPEHLRPFAQIFVEFHHQTVAGYEFEHTLALVQRIERFGFSAFTLDDRNWLFWQP